MSIEELSASISEYINNMFGFSDQLYGELIWSTILLIGFVVFGYIVEHIFEHYFKKWAKNVVLTQIN